MSHFSAPKSFVTFYCTRTRAPSCDHSPDWAAGDAQCTHLLPRISFVQLPEWQCQADLLGYPVKGTRLWIMGSKGVCNISHGSYHDVESSVFCSMLFDKRLESSNCQIATKRASVFVSPPPRSRLPRALRETSCVRPTKAFGSEI